jgi:hypothetical protein
MTNRHWVRNETENLKKQKEILERRRDGRENEFIEKIKSTKD